jgi:hypothetical protein
MLVHARAHLLIKDLCRSKIDPRRRIPRYQLLGMTAFAGPRAAQNQSDCRNVVDGETAFCCVMNALYGVVRGSAIGRHNKTDKSFCFFFQKEALSFLKKRNKKLLSIWCGVEEER